MTTIKIYKLKDEKDLLIRNYHKIKNITQIYDFATASSLESGGETIVSAQVQNQFMIVSSYITQKY